MDQATGADQREHKEMLEAFEPVLCQPCIDWCHCEEPLRAA